MSIILKNIIYIYYIYIRLYIINIKQNRKWKTLIMNSNLRQITSYFFGYYIYLINTKKYLIY